MKNTQEGFVVMLVVVVVAIVAIGGGVYTYHNKKNKIEPEVRNTTEVGYKTYTDSSMSFVYPNDWIVGKGKDGSAIYLSYPGANDSTVIIDSFDSTDKNIEASLPIFVVPTRRVDTRETVVVNGKKWTELVVEGISVVRYAYIDGKAYYVQYANFADTESKQSKIVADSIRFVE